MSDINIHILNANNTFSKNYIAIINKAFTRASRKTRELLKELPNVDVVFYDNSSQVIPATGIGGNTENANTIIIPLDSSFGISKEELFLTICHELHHTARMMKLGDTDSLLKKVISEGLAVQFEVEINPKHTPATYKNEVTHDQLIKGMKDLQKINQTGEYDYYEWFFGYGQYPNWFGYALGVYIIDQYNNINKTTPSQLVHKPAEDFIGFIETLERTKKTKHYE